MKHLPCAATLAPSPPFHPMAAPPGREGGQGGRLVMGSGVQHRGPNPSSTASSSGTPGSASCGSSESVQQPREERPEAQPSLTDGETEAQLASSVVPGVQEAATNPGPSEMD